MSRVILYSRIKFFVFKLLKHFIFFSCFFYYFFSVCFFLCKKYLCISIKSASCLFTSDFFFSYSNIKIEISKIFIFFLVCVFFFIFCQVCTSTACQQTWNTSMLLQIYWLTLKFYVPINVTKRSKLLSEDGICNNVLLQMSKTN